MDPADDMVAPGHSLEMFPDQMAAVRDAGHEMYDRPTSFSGQYTEFDCVFPEAYTDTPMKILSL